MKFRRIGSIGRVEGTLVALAFMSAGCGAPALESQDLTHSSSPAVTPTVAPDPVILSGLTIEPNPVNTLSCVVTWETDIPSTSRVEFGEGEGLSFYLEDDALVLEHRVVVIGMRPERAYNLRVISTAPGAAPGVADALSHSSGALPPEVYPLTMGLHRPEAMEPGWTLTNNHNKQLKHRPTAVMYDEDGEVVWYFINQGWADDLGSVDTRFLDTGEVLIGPSGLNPPVKVSLGGELLWTGPAQPNTGTDQAHHHCDQLPNGDYVTLVRETQDDRWGDRIVQYSADYSETWSWSPFDWLEPYGDSDWTHNNSVTVSLSEDVAYLNSRNLSKIFKLSYIDGSIIWSFGKGGDFAPDPSADEPWFIFQHDPEVLSGGSILLYDNGNETNDIRPWTRVVEYALDEETMTSKIIWEWPGSFEVPEFYTTEFHSPVGGDADRLPNGNTLITISMRTAEAKNSRLVEVTPEGEIVFEGLLPMTDEWVVGAYRAQRIPAPIGRL